MRAVKQLQGYQTSDGQGFIDEAQAESHQLNLDRKDQLEALLGENLATSHMNSLDDVIEVLIERADEVSLALQGNWAPKPPYVASEDDGDEPDSVDARGVLDPPDVVEDFRGVEVPRPPSADEILTTDPRADDDIPF